jgi:hypothetical protein
VSHAAPPGAPRAGQVEASRIRRRAATGGRDGSAVAISLLLLALAAFALSGCETNQERSARAEKLLRAQRLAHPTTVLHGLAVTRQNPLVKVLSTAVVHDENGTAAAVTLRNLSAKPLRDAPIAITVYGARNAVLYQNNAPGLDSTLVSVPLLKPGAQTVWVDDQVQAAGTPSAVSARVGASPTVSGPLPELSVEGVHTFEEPSNGVGAQGTIVNHSAVAQQQLVVYAVGRRGGRIVAAGRAVLPEVPAGQSVPFQVFFIGNPQGTQLEISAPPSTLG